MEIELSLSHSSDVGTGMRFLQGRYWLRVTEPTLHEGQLCVCVFSVVVREANNVRT